MFLILPRNPLRQTWIIPALIALDRTILERHVFSVYTQAQLTTNMQLWTPTGLVLRSFRSLKRWSSRTGQVMPLMVRFKGSCPPWHWNWLQAFVSFGSFSICSDLSGFGVLVCVSRNESDSNVSLCLAFLLACRDIFTIFSESRLWFSPSA